MMGTVLDQTGLAQALRRQSPHPQETSTPPVALNFYLVSCKNDFSDHREDEFFLKIIQSRSIGVSSRESEQGPGRGATQLLVCGRRRRAETWLRRGSRARNTVDSLMRCPYASPSQVSHPHVWLPWLCEERERNKKPEREQESALSLEFLAIKIWCI